MDTASAWVLVVLIVALGFTIATVVELLNPRPPKSKFDVINDELKRLHSQAEDSPALGVMVYEQISTLNKDLINEKEA